MVIRALPARAVDERPAAGLLCFLARNLPARHSPGPSQGWKWPPSRGTSGGPRWIRDRGQASPSLPNQVPWAPLPNCILTMSPGFAYSLSFLQDKQRMALGQVVVASFLG